MEKITKNTVKKIKNIDEPFNSYESIYFYLIKNRIINFSYKYFKYIMKLYNKNNSEQWDKNNQLNKTEYHFCEIINLLKSKTIYCLYKSLYEQSLGNPNIGLKFLKLYDRKEKKYDEMIKIKNINQPKDNDKKISIQSIDEFLFLIQNPQNPNNINISHIENISRENNIKDIDD